MKKLPRGRPQPPGRRAPGLHPPAPLDLPRKAQASPLEARIDVGRIVDPGDTARHERRRQARPRHGEQRAQEADLGPLDEGRHAGQPVRTADARRTHRNRLGLVVGMMGHEKMEKAALPAGVAQQPVSGGTRRFLEAGLRLGAFPAPDEAFDATASQQGRRHRGFHGRLGPQAMIDDQRQDPAASPGRPFVRQQGEAERVAAA
jgi:hypothetical protein